MRVVRHLPDIKCERRKCLCCGTRDGVKHIEFVPGSQTLYEACRACAESCATFDAIRETMKLSRENEPG